jgi:serine/threonine protein kinase
MVLQPGMRLGPYEVLSLIGAGGMGEVWLATELSLGRKVALKIVPPDLTRDSGRALRFEQEARSASALNHPNVCHSRAVVPCAQKADTALGGPVCQQAQERDQLPPSGRDTSGSAPRDCWLS